MNKFKQLDDKVYHKLTKVSGKQDIPFENGDVYLGPMKAWLEYEPASMSLDPKAWFVAVPENIKFSDMGFAGGGMRTSSIKNLEEIPNGYRIHTSNSIYEITT